MPDRRILFSDPMIRAILSGRKTQTRRVIRRMPKLFEVAPGQLCEVAPSQIAGETPARIRTGNVITTRTLPYGVGDRIWVRETWTARMSHGWTIADARSRMYREEILYRADGHASIDGWWPSIHMPREFSRLTLTVTGLRMQRLQDISEDDAVAEGVEQRTVTKLDGSDPQKWWFGHQNGRATAKSAFRDLWDSLNAKRGFGWDMNLWVCAVTFTAHRCNIDQMEDRA